MNMRLLLVTGIFSVALLVVASTAAAALPMPPRFEAAGDPADTLVHYPLGVITRDAALIHHGKAHWTTKLPNGREGWVYEYGSRNATYSYTLEFGRDGTVIDVVYRRADDKRPLSALGLQMPKIGEAQPRHRLNWQFQGQQKVPALK